VNGLTYYYRVSAVNVMGEGPLSGEASVTPTSIHLPPTGFHAGLSGEDSENVTLTWGLSPDDGAGQDTVVGYAIYRNMTFDPDGSGYGLFTLLPKGTSGYIDVLSGDGNPINYFYRICAIDSSSQASCSDTQTAKFTRPLSQGFNFVSIPLVLSDGSIENVLQNVHFERAWSYDSMLGEWSSYVKSKPYKGDLDEVDHTLGYWIDVVKESNLTVAGVVPLTTSIQLTAGLNLIGLPSFSSAITVGDLRAATGATLVEGFDPSNPPFFTRPLTDSEILQSGYGYWVMVEIDTTWTLNNY
jgi:hypothetical protein